MAKKENQGYFYIIPAKLAESGNATKALLFGLIVSLANKDGYCWANNKYLAKKLGRKDKSTISGYITELEEEGWLIREGRREKRRLRVGMKSKYLENSNEVIGKNQRGSLEKTYNSNIREYNKSSNKERTIKKIDGVNQEWIPGIGWTPLEE